MRETLGGPGNPILEIAFGRLALKILHMGLVVRFGASGWPWESDLARINAELSARGLRTHAEPTGLEELLKRQSYDMPYEFLSELRHVYLAPVAELVSEVSDERGPDELERLDEAADGENSHLCNHSDCDGVYLPIDFAKPFWIGRLSVGSVVRLRAELHQASLKIGAIRKALQVQTRPSEQEDDCGEDDSDEDDCDEQGLLYSAEYALDELWRACDVSLGHLTALVFS